jgi:2-methylcitrate dehydratase PrpD
MSVATKIADKIVNTRYEDLPADAIHWAKVAVLDTIGVTVAGSVEPLSKIVNEILKEEGGRPDCTVLGLGVKTSALNAAWANGVLSHALDYDDISNTLGGHPSVPVLPALLALAENQSFSGKAFLLAYAVGFETECRIGKAVNFVHYDRGWHPTSTVGIFGASAAAAKLLGLTAPDCARALAMAASMASGIKANFGTMTKPLHIGQAARNGLLATRLASKGFSANPEALEAKQGFCNVFNGEAQYRLEAMTEEWGEPFNLVRPGIAIKQYPCCGSTHSAIDALLSLVRRHNLKAQDAVSVTAAIHPRRLVHVNRPSPSSGLEGKFSLQYCLARSLLDGQVVLGHFRDDAVGDPRVGEIMQKIKVGSHSAMDWKSTEHYGAEVTVELRSGEKLKAFQEKAIGRGPEIPLPESVLRAKFLDCWSQLFPRAAGEGLVEKVGALETLTDVRTLFESFSAAGR